MKNEAPHLQPESFMRILLDVVAITTVIGLVILFTVVDRRQVQEQDDVMQVVEGLRSLQQQLHYNAAAERAELNQSGWPDVIDPAWFGNDPPRNLLVKSPTRPWLQIAGPEEASLEDPLMRMAVNDGVAGFWYNPYNGVVRARVPVMVSDQDAVNLYNRINNTALVSVFPSKNQIDLAERTEANLMAAEDAPPPMLKIYVRQPGTEIDPNAIGPDLAKVPDNQ